MSDTKEGEYLPYDPDAEEERGAEQEYDDEVLSNEEMLNFSQKIRKGLVSEMTRKGMPVDKDERTSLLQALRDMDQTSVNRLRLDVDKENNAGNRAAQEIVNRLYQANPYGLRARPGEERDTIPEPSLDELPDIEFTEGEKEVGLITETASDFLKRMEDED